MKIELTNIWKIDNVLVIANSIDEAILIYRTYNGNCSNWYSCYDCYSISY